MGTEIDVVDQRYFQTQIEEYLSNDYLNIVSFISVQMIERAENDEKYRELFGRIDYMLPSEETLLLSYYGETRKYKHAMCGCKSLKMIDHKIQELSKVVWILCSKEEDGQLLKQLIRRDYPNIQVAGVETIVDEQDTERVVNAINAVVPDVLLCAMESPLQEEWLFHNSALLNSKLCFALGEIMNEIRKYSKETPGFIKKLKIEKLYDYLKNRGSDRTYKARLFRKKLEQYNNKKGE